MTQPLRLSKAEVRQVIEALIEQAEMGGTVGDYCDAAQNPLVYGAFLLLQQLHLTHPHGITGTLRAIQEIEQHLFRLNE